MEVEIFKSISEFLSKINYKDLFYLLLIYYSFFILCCFFNIMPEKYQQGCLPAAIFFILSSTIYYVCRYRPSCKEEQKQAKTFHLTFENNCWIRSTQHPDSTWNTQIYISFEVMNRTDNPLKLNFNKIVKPKIGEIIDSLLLSKHSQGNLYGRNCAIHPRSIQPGTLEIFIKGKYKMRKKKVFTKLLINDSEGNTQKIDLYLRNNND